MTALGNAVQGSGSIVLATSPSLTTPNIGVASSTSLATSAASPLLLTNGKLVTIALTSQTVNPTTLTIPDFASVNDTFAFVTLAQTLVNKTLTTPTIGSFTNATHNHQAAAGGGTLAEAALALTDITTNDVSTSAHGFAPKLWANAWVSYTPTWTGASTNPVIGNGTLAGYYKQVGKTVYCRIEVVMGSTTTYGSGAYSWALPVTALALSASTANDTLMPVGNIAIFAGTSSPGTAFLGTTTTVQARVPVTVAGANPVYTNYTGLVAQGLPVTIGNTNTIALNFSYEAA